MSAAPFPLLVSSAHPDAQTAATVSSALPLPLPAWSGLEHTGGIGQGQGWAGTDCFVLPVTWGWDRAMANSRAG